MTFYAPTGTVGPWLSLQQLLHDVHESARQSINARIAQLKSDKVPLDNVHADWKESARELADKAFAAEDRADSRSLLRQALAVADGGLREVGPYQTRPEVDGIEVRLRALRARDLSALRARLARCEYKGSDGTSPEAWEADGAFYDAIRPFLAACVAGVRGHLSPVGEPLPAVEAEGALPEDVLDTLEAAGMLVYLFSAARDWQALNPLQRRGFGLPRPSTSPSSTAAAASTPCDVPEGATLTGSAPHTSQGQISRRDDVLDLSSVTTSGSQTLSRTTAPAMGSQASAT